MPNYGSSGTGDTLQSREPMQAGSTPGKGKAKPKRKAPPTAATKAKLKQGKPKG